MDSTSQLLTQPAPPARPRWTGPDLDSPTAAQASPSHRSAGATARLSTAISRSGIVRLQYSAGNAAVAGLLAARSTAGRATVQRCGPIPPDQCPCHDNDDNSSRQNERPAAAPTRLQRATESTAVAGLRGHGSGFGQFSPGVAVQRDDSGGVLDYLEKKGEAVVDSVAGAATSAVDTVSGAASAVGDVVSEQVRAARRALAAYLEGKTAEAVALIARLQSQLGTLATMIIPADKLAELNGRIASVNSRAKGLVSVPSIGGAAGGEAGEASASPGAVSGLLASLQSAMLSLSSSAKSPPVQRLASEAAMIAFEQGLQAGTITIEAEAIPAVVAAPETAGISIPVALAIAGAVAVVAGLIGYAVYRHTHPEKRPWGPADEATYAQLQRLEPIVAAAPGVDYSVKPAHILADPDKSAKWDECVALHQKYEPTKKLYVDAAGPIDVIKAKIAAGTATSDDYNKFCELLRARIKLAEQLATERFDYVANDCDDLPWPVAPGETPKTPDERRKGHIDQFEQNLNSMKRLLAELARTWC